ncbi:response regulator [Methylobacterium organophilum]|uniref:response regulator n=1 Tax=Methylobacterium organophilum TaxID=410 RepID=UPI0030844118
MAHANPDHRVALVVEEDADLRNLASVLIEETDLDVIACESAEAALSVLERPDVDVAMVLADTALAGAMDGVALARTVDARWPEVRLVVTSKRETDRASELPSHAVFLRKPWVPLAVLVQAERAALAPHA